MPFSFDVKLIDVKVMLENWLCFVTICLAFAYAVLSFFIESCRSRTGGLYEALQGMEVRANVSPLNTTFTIVPSRQHNPDNADNPGVRSFSQNGVVITSSDESREFTTVLESGTVVRWTNKDSCRQLIETLFGSASPSEKSLKKWRRRSKDSLKNSRNKQRNIDIVSRNEYSSEVTKDNAEEVVQILGEILQPYCRGMDLTPVLNDCLKKLKQGLVIDRVYEHRLQVLSKTNSGELLWLMYSMKVTRVKSWFRAAVKRANMDLSYFALRTNQTVLENLLRERTTECRHLFVLEERAGGRANDDGGGHRELCIKVQ